MRSILLALTLAASALLPAAAGAAVTTECLPSLEAARAAHPVDWLAWSGPVNDRCYFKGHKGDRSTGKLNSNTARPDGDMRRAAGLADGRSARGSGAVPPATATNSTPLPQPRPHSAPPARINAVIVMPAAAPGSFADRFAAAYGMTAFAMGGR